MSYSIYYLIGSTKHIYLSQESSMAQQLFKTDLEIPSVDYFCIYCKKMLKDSLRIISKLDNEARSYVNMCPSCLANYEPQVEQYKICGRMNEVVDSLNSLTMDTALKCINVVEKNGIQTIELLRETEGQENQLKQQYLKLNEKIFEPKGLGFLEPQSKYVAEQFKQIVKDKNPPNRKHLKALGYNWQRQEFQNQPESIFGILLSTLTQEDYEDVDYEKLSSILYRQYMKEQEQCRQIKDYLVNTMFLLGKKGLNREQGMPDILQDIRSKQQQLKEIIPKVCNLVNDTGDQISNRNKKSQEGQSDDDKSLKQANERSRTREKEKKRQKRSERFQKRKEKRKHFILKRKTSKSRSKVSQDNEEISLKPKVPQGKQRLSQDNEGKKEQIPIKRGRGRPKKSVSNANLQAKILLQAISTPEKPRSRQRDGPKC